MWFWHKKPVKWEVLPQPPIRLHKESIHIIRDIMHEELNIALGNLGKIELRCCQCNGAMSIVGNMAWCSACQRGVSTTVRSLDGKCICETCRKGRVAKGEKLLPLIESWEGEKHTVVCL